MTTPLVLGSASPARLAVLRAAGVEARVFGKALQAGEAPGTQPGLVQHFYPGLSRWPLSGAPPTLRRALKGIVHGASMAGLRGVLAQWRPHVIHFQWAFEVEFLVIGYLGGLWESEPPRSKLRDSWRPAKRI